MKILVTGGSGFIGSNLIHHLIKSCGHTVVNVDKLTYAGNPLSLSEFEDTPSHYAFECVDICDRNSITNVFEKHTPDAIMHLAAESHVDRSIDGAAPFIQTNIVGTFNLLECASTYWASLPLPRKGHFKFIHISTDEVYGSLGTSGSFSEESPYQPNSPYSASKASSDHLVRAWYETYRSPTIITNCSNNYGPFQFPEKLIPVVILNAINERPIPVYGKGEHVRDWLYVEDHAKALELILSKGIPGQTYNIGGDAELSNLELVKNICKTLDVLAPRANAPYQSLITFVKDRPGHDFRYSIDYSKIKRELGWSPQVNLEAGLQKTIHWYLNNTHWIDSCRRSHSETQRLGTKILTTHAS